MTTVRRRGITALTAAAALAIGVIPAAFTTSSILASGEEPTTLDAGSASAGQVVLSTSADKGTITWKGQTQEITGGQQCEVSSTGANILQITGSVGFTDTGEPLTGEAGFRDGDIGVFEASAPASSPNNASQCFRVDSGSFTETESLTLALHPDGSFSDAPFADRLKVGSATVDARVANTRNGVITVSLLGPVPATGEAPVLKATDVPWFREKSGNPIDVPAEALTYVDGFDAVRLTATAGSFSIRGAKFNLDSAAEYLMNCTDRNLISETEGGATTTILYTGNADGSPCTEGFGVTLDSMGAKKFMFLKASGVDPTAEFVVTRSWTVGLPPGDAKAPATLVDFGNTAAEGDDVSIGWCPGAEYDAAGKLTGIATTPTTDLYTATTTVEYACVGKQSAKAVGSELQVDEQIYLYGDVIMRKP